MQGQKSEGKFCVSSSLDIFVFLSKGETVRYSIVTEL